METTISLQRILQVLKQTWWKIVIIALIVMLLAGVYTEFMIQKKYASSVEFYIVNTDPGDVTESVTTLSANEYLAANYIAVIKGDSLLQEISDYLDEEYDVELKPSKIRSMLSTSTDSKASTFTVTVTSADPHLSYQVADAITTLAPSLVTDIARPSDIQVKVPIKNVLKEISEKLAKDFNDKQEESEYLLDIADRMHRDDYSAVVDGEYVRVECIFPNRFPVENENPVSPSLVKNCLLAGVLAAVAAFAIFLLLTLYNSVIRSEDDVRSITELPIIGTIPEWETATSKSSYGADTDYRHQGGQAK